MLEAEEVDDDFFTPVASTSLASIFGNMSKQTDSNENDSLKYIPPKPQHIVPKKREPSKASECIFACALIVHEWCNNVYTSRGKLGFAIIKIQKTGDHNIVLYDSVKTTLSRTLISPQLEVTIKNNSYISYYDALRKYWSIYGTDEEVKKIDDILNSLGANVVYSNNTDNVPQQPNNSESGTIASLEEKEQNRGSDTDSSVNKKTKISILNRMANMGHSVLPTKILPLEKTSDSSDTNEPETQPKVFRHKTSKSLIKRNNVENIVSESQQLTEAHQRIIVPNTQPDKNVTVYSHHGQFIPLSNTSVIANTNNELSMFMAEQRIGNSEMRINLNRITDKVDSVLNKINSLELKDANVPTDILLKLLKEYENKIKAYEELLRSRGIDEKNNIEEQLKVKDKDVERIKNKMSEVENVNTVQTNEISKLQKQIRVLEEQNIHEKQIQTSRENELMIKINILENRLEEKNKQLSDITSSESTKTDPNDDNTEDKVKNIMNNTFQTISMNFENSNTYTGETIKRIVGTVIKKITINALSELKNS
ncbi:unnamed protein product [Arctia plantaginis]|uniref:Uncharacterized protein n=1 Tax=Arctia plantaginis TaxID=874455 RepID=A0A8S0ZRR3_ARCPL|nr:unnamed protein product [Arctia plantaginis]CAB3238504.1 unnamed protein product [Arctia plantaginis]